jgi:hypothetical protein
MWTDLEQRYIAARCSVVDEISLFLVGQDEDDTQTFLVRWNATLENDILVEPPTAKSEFIWRLIESVMARVRAIAAAAKQEPALTGVFTILGFVEHLHKVEKEMKEVEAAIVAKACEMVCAEAKRVIGVGYPEWPALSPETLAR